MRRAVAARIRLDPARVDLITKDWRAVHMPGRARCCRARAGEATVRSVHETGRLSGMHINASVRAQRVAVSPDVTPCRICGAHSRTSRGLAAQFALVRPSPQNVPARGCEVSPNAPGCPPTRAGAKRTHGRRACRGSKARLAADRVTACYRVLHPATWCNRFRGGEKRTHRRGACRDRAARRAAGMLHRVTGCYAVQPDATSNAKLEKRTHRV